MPGLTKKKVRQHTTSSGRRASGTSRADKDIGAVARFARDNKTALKALGWIMSPAAMAAKTIIDKKKNKKKDSTRVGQSKGGRGSEKDKRSRGKR